eukprot:sb/3472519/
MAGHAKILGHYILLVLLYWLLIRWLVDQNDKFMKKLAPGHSTTNITSKQHHYQFIASGCGSLLFQIFAVVLLNSLIESGAQSILMDMMSAVGRMSLGFYNKMPLPSLLGRFVVDLELIGRPLMDCYSDPDLVTSDLVAPRFSDRINFPRYRKLTVFDPDLVATPI